MGDEKEKMIELFKKNNKTKSINFLANKIDKQTK